MKRVIVVLCLLVSATAWAHQPSDAHLRLELDGDELRGRIDVALRDLDAAVGLDSDGDGALTWAEVSAAAWRIDAYLAQRLAIAGCALAVERGALVDLSSGTYWTAPLRARCTPTDRLAITYRLLFDIDAQHRGLVHIGDQTVIIRDATPVVVTAGARSSFLAFVREGVWHIWIGIDHVLFLVCLILPAVFPRRHAIDSLRAVARETIEIVTAFTLAHSITLVLAAIGFVQLPSRLVETAIAISVVAAALNNLVRVIDARWAVAFALGLLHGFGFSSVLVDLGLPSDELVGSLLAFNLGVELGQTAIVVLLLPVLYAIRRTLAYQAVLWGGSAAIAIVATLWTYERML